MQENQINVSLPKLVSGLFRFFGRVNEPEINNFDIGSLESLCDTLDITCKALLQSVKLRPVGIQVQYRTDLRGQIGERICDLKDRSSAV